MPVARNVSWQPPHHVKMPRVFDMTNSVEPKCSAQRRAGMSYVAGTAWANIGAVSVSRLL